jgi:hypothetical protein
VVVVVVSNGELADPDVKPSPSSVSTKEVTSIRGKRSFVIKVHLLRVVVRPTPESIIYVLGDSQTRVILSVALDRLTVRVEDTRGVLPTPKHDPQTGRKHKSELKQDSQQ